MITAVTQVEDGKEGLNGLLESLNIPISNEAQQYLVKAGNIREQVRSNRDSENKGRYLRRLQEAVLHCESREQLSYAPGVCDAGAVPSGDMSSTLWFKKKWTKKLIRT